MTFAQPQGTIDPPRGAARRVQRVSDTPVNGAVGRSAVLPDDSTGTIAPWA
eukprot:COSAG02_NODE_4810_length_4952_cov_2.157222_5_plen_51_part_00